MNKKWDTEKFSKRVNEIDPGYKLISEYVSNHKKVRIHHSVCGCDYSVSPTNFLRGIGWCSKCAIEKRREKMRKTSCEFAHEIQLLVGDDYSVISEYTGANSKILFKHTGCSKEFSMTPSNFLQGQRCPHCFSSVSRRYTREQVQKIINTVLDESYTLVSDYKNNHTQILVSHSCGNIWKTKLRDIHAGNRCPFCTNMSKGEEKIHKYLREMDYDAVFQYRDDRCRNKLQLPFDFYIPSLNTLIEFDGIFHYEIVINEETLLNQQRNDRIKNEFAKKYGINLIRIPYWEFENIEKILERELH